MKAGFKFHNLLTWDKGTVTPNRFYMHKTEFCLFLYKGKAKYINNMSDSNLFNVLNKKTTGHPTEKPIELMKNWIENSTNKNDLVIDPFMGANSTGIACLFSKRKFIGGEIEKKWFDIANERIKKETKNMSTMYEE